MLQDKHSLKILVDGIELPVYHHQGRHYVEAILGKSYEILLTAPIYNRYCAVLSVDGLSVMTGRRATLDDAGYIVGGSASNSAIKVPGFRLNDSEVARFVFGLPDQSYAALMDSPANIGIIGAVFYVERDNVRESGWGQGDSTLRGGGLLGGSMTRGGAFGSGSRGHDRGTIFGDRLPNQVEHIPFHRGEVVARINIEYASREALIKAGIISHSPLGEVSAFSEESGCRPPKGWR